MAGVYGPSTTVSGRLQYAHTQVPISNTTHGSCSFMQLIDLCKPCIMTRAESIDTASSAIKHLEEVFASLHNCSLQFSTPSERAEYKSVRST